MRGDRNKHGVLRLQFNPSDSMVVHREGDEDSLLRIQYEEGTPGGRITLSFDGADYKVFRQKVWNEENAKRGLGDCELNDPLPDF